MAQFSYQGAATALHINNGTNPKFKIFRCSIEKNPITSRVNMAIAPVQARWDSTAYNPNTGVHLLRLRISTQQLHYWRNGANQSSQSYSGTVRNKESKRWSSVKGRMRLNTNVTMNKLRYMKTHHTTIWFNYGMPGMVLFYRAIGSASHEDTLTRQFNYCLELARCSW